MIFKDCNDFLKYEIDRLFSDEYIENLINVNRIKKEVKIEKCIAKKNIKYILEDKTYLKNTNKNKKNRIEWRFKSKNGKYLFLHIEIAKLTKQIEFNQGYEIHHFDGDSENNNPENLIVLPSPMHREFHNGSIRAIEAINKIHSEMIKKFFI